MNGASQRLCLFTIAVCAIAIYAYPLALRTPLLDPDEGLHATIAQGMVVRGDYLIPRVNGEPFRDKPFLYSAAQALSLRVFGMNEAAVRIPGFLFALLGVVTSVLLARRLFDGEVALYAALAALTLVLPIILTQSPAHDVALIPWTNLIVLSFWNQEQSRTAKQAWGWVAAMSVFIALAFLTKGLIGVAVIGTGLGLYSLLSHSITKAQIARCSVALIAGALLVSPWYLTMEHASPGYLYYYFVNRHVLGYLTEGQEHGESGWYYYFGPVLGGAMPWLVFAAAAVMQLRYDVAKPRNRATLLLACWFIGGFIFLTAAGSKLLTYSLPLFPPIAILAGLGFRRFFHSELATAPRWLFVSGFRSAAIFGIVGPIPALSILSKFLAAPSPPAAYGVAALASIAMAAGLVLFERQQGRQALAVGMLWFPLIFICLMTWPVQVLAELNSQRALAALLNASDSLPDEIVIMGQRVGSVLFYLSPDKRKSCENSRIREALDSEVKTLIPPPPGTMIAVTHKELEHNKRVAEMRALKPQVVGALNVVMGPQANDAHVAERPERAPE